MEENLNTFIFDEKPALEDFLLKKWQEISENSIKDKNSFIAALSGGNTPRGFYKKLAECKDSCDWSKTHIFIVDERFVPVDDRESNFRMIGETLIDRVPLPPGHVHPIKTDKPDPQAAADEYEKELRDFFAVSGNGLPVFDLIMLGMGEDGHTASLFPETGAPEEENRLVCAVYPPSKKNSRVSLTFPVINAAKNVFFMIAGKSKAETVRDVVEGRNKALPAAKVRPDKGNLLFLLDREAALFLAPRGEVLK